MAQCSQNVPTEGLRIHYHQCFREAKVVRKGKPYCRQHDPVEVEARTQATQERWQKEFAAKEVVWRREARKRRIFTRMWKLLEQVHNSMTGRQYVIAKRLIKAAKTLDKQSK